MKLWSIYTEVDFSVYNGVQYSFMPWDVVYFWFRMNLLLLNLIIPCETFPKKYFEDILILLHYTSNGDCYMS